MKKHIPNLFTSLNLLSGWCSVYFAFQHEIKVSVLLIMVAALFDLLDGFMARLLKVDSPLGAQLDSFADLITFGLAPAFIVFNMVHHQFNSFLGLDEIYLFIILGVIPVNAAIRLAKFNISEEKNDDFIGLPSPAFALCVISVTLYLLYHPTLLLGYSTHYALGAILLSFTMVSKIKFVSFKFKSADYHSNKGRYIILFSSFLVTVLLLILRKPFVVLPIILLLYFIISILNNYNR